MKNFRFLIALTLALAGASFSFGQTVIRLDSNDIIQADAITTSNGNNIISGINANASGTFNWARVNKTGSSLADLATRNWSDLQNIDPQVLSLAGLAFTANKVVKVNSAGTAFELGDDLTGGGGLSDGDFGDITVSGTGTVFTIDAGTITLAKMAAMSDVTTHDATTSAHGFMSKLDKVKLDAITGTNTGNQTGATLPTTPAGDVAATNADAAIAELASEKQTAAQVTTAITNERTASATLTTKVIDGDDNTVQDLGVASLKANALVTAAEGAASSDNDTSVLTTATAIDLAESKVANSITDGVTTSAPNQDQVFDALAGKAATTAIDNTAYDATSWNGDTTHAPTKDAIRDKIESMGGGGLTRQTFSNAAVTVSVGTTVLAQTGTMSASRVVTLPAASSYSAGASFALVDESGTVTTTNTLVLTRAGSDTINGATTYTVTTANTARYLFSDGSSKWTIGKIKPDEVETLTFSGATVTRLTDKTIPNGGTLGTDVGTELAIGNTVIATLRGQDNNVGGVRYGALGVLALDSTQGGWQAALRIISTSGSFSVGDSDHFIIYANASGGTAGLPSAAAAFTVKRVYEFKAVGAGSLVVDPASTETIFTTSDVSTVTLTTGQSLRIISNGTNWVQF